MQAILYNYAQVALVAVFHTAVDTRFIGPVILTYVPASVVLLVVLLLVLLTQVDVVKHK